MKEQKEKKNKNVKKTQVKPDILEGKNINREQPFLGCSLCFSKIFALRLS